MLSFSEEEFHGWGHQMGRGGAGHKRPPAQTQIPPGPGGAEHPTPMSLSCVTGLLLNMSVSMEVGEEVPVL